MYNNIFVPNLVPFGCERIERCERREFNGYSFPAPICREMKHLDTVQLTIHTDKFVRKECIRGECCEPVPVIVEDERKSFIITAETECIKPGFYYQLDIDRDVPYEVTGLNTYIRLVPCGFFRDKIELNFTKNIRGCGVEGDIDARSIEGFNGDCDCDHIPADPAFPAQDFVGWHGFHEDDKAHLVPVKLDLHGSICTGENFFTGRHKVPGTGRPYSNRFVLFLNNSGEFVLSRNIRRRSDYA